MECGWRVETGEPVAGYAIRPDGCLDLLYSREEGLRVVGAMTAGMRLDLPAGARTAGIRFQPGMAGAFLRATPGDLTDLIVPAEALWERRARELSERLGNSPSTADWIAILFEALRLPDAPNPVQRAIRAMAAAHGLLDLDWVARQANLGARQFRRRSIEEAGLAPKHLCRVLRFRRACELAACLRRPEWAGIAADAGYFDQAHLVRDFREFAGASPMTVFSNRPPADCPTMTS